MCVAWLAAFLMLTGEAPQHVSRCTQWIYVVRRFAAKKLRIEIVHHDTTPTSVRLKGHRSKVKDQGHRAKVQKGERAAGMSYALYRVTQVSLHNYFKLCACSNRSQ